MEQQPRASLDLNLPCDEQAPGAVRLAMSSLRAVGPSLGDAMLVASELVTNAVRHSGCTERDSIDVAVHRYDHHLMISVHDPGGAERKAQIPPLTECAAEAMGLRIVEELTSRWGSERRDGYVVWAELPLSVYATAQQPVTRRLPVSAPAPWSVDPRPRRRPPGRPCFPGPA